MPRAASLPHVLVSNESEQEAPGTMQAEAVEEEEVRRLQSGHSSRLSWDPSHPQPRPQTELHAQICEQMGRHPAKPVSGHGRPADSNILALPRAFFPRFHPMLLGAARSPMGNLAQRPVQRLCTRRRKGCGDELLEVVATPLPFCPHDLSSCSLAEHGFLCSLEEPRSRARPLQPLFLHCSQLQHLLLFQRGDPSASMMPLPSSHDPCTKPATVCEPENRYLLETCPELLGATLWPTAVARLRSESLPTPPRFRAALPQALQLDLGSVASAAA
mmetsp:Transcript_42304/g.98691  ORF Transcript_42304/g.98691 Transcript_42304/m.98691 type:complete len:273 (-) Transcript_42304:189-1007(-)